MAKISARGAYKLAEATRDREMEFAGRVDHLRDYLVLRSDGTMLIATSNRDGRDAYGRRRSGYKLWARFKPEVDHSAAGLRAAFERYCALKGWSL